MGGVGRRRDQRLISPARLAELEELAQDGKDMRAALQSLGPKRFEMMEAIRTGIGAAHRARGWLEHESDLGPSPLSMVDVVDDYVGLLHDERTADGKVHPSSAWGCARRAVYEMRGVPPSNPHSLATMRRFRIGHILHSLVSSALAISPDVLEYYAEFEIESDTEAGNGDVLVELENGTWAVIEAKSSKDAHPKLDERHARQAAHYAVHARTRGVLAGGHRIEPLGERLSGALVVYFGKQALDVTEYWLPYDPAWEQRLDGRLAELGRYRDDPQSIPPRLIDARSRKSRACYGCPWVDLCWNRDPANIDPRGGRE